MIKLTNKVDIRVRYADTDKMGYLYNGNYFAYFEVGRTELMRAYGMIYKDLEDNGYILPLIDTYAKYIKPAYYDDLLTIEATLNYENAAIIQFDYNILKDNTIITNGFTRHIFVTVDKRIPVKPPKMFMNVINKFGSKF